MDRRQVLMAGMGALGALAAGGCTKSVVNAAPPASGGGLVTAADLTLAKGTPYPLVALPGKGPMGQVYDRPPNYETPADKLIGQQNYPYTDNEYYYVRYREASVLDVEKNDYTLTLGGDAADNQIVLTYDELTARADTTVGAVGMCSGEGRGLHHPMIPGMPWTKGDLSCAEWTGVKLKNLLAEVGVKDSAKFIAFRGGRIISLAKPQYWRAYPADAIPDDTIVAVQMNGEDIPFWNGYPARLVVPGTWAPPWVKQLVEIDVRTTDHPMEWSGRKITPNRLAPFSLTVTPTDGTVVPVGRPIEFTGIAFDKGDGIATVEYSLDDAKTWRPARLGKSYGKYTWRVWKAEITFDSPGPATVVTRATTTQGEVQQLDPSPDAMKNSARKELPSRTFAAHVEVTDR